jgi:hypothetical protein
MVLICGLASVALLLPGIMLAVMYFFSFHAVILEGRSGANALRRSAFIVRSFWARTFFLVFLCGGFVNIIASLPGIGLVIFQNFMDRMVFDIIQSTLSQVATLFVSPLLSILGTVVYYDLRTVKEGLDIELAIESMEHATPAEPGVTG